MTQEQGIVKGDALQKMGSAGLAWAGIVLAGSFVICPVFGPFVSL